MAPDTEDTMALHPEQLSRRISEIDLTSRGPRNVLPEFRPVYSNDELHSLRYGNHDGAVPVPDVKFDGVLTPPSVSHPNVPPASPADHSSNNDGSIDDEGRGSGDNGNEGLVMSTGQTKKPRKKKNKRGSKKTLKVITGFEEFYADPPVTPTEHEEESDLYNESRDFHERIQTCIQRYRRRRKLDETRALIMTRFFILGGIEASGSKNFTGGLDKDTIENSTADEIAAIQATDFVRAGTTNSRYYDPLSPEGWVVDFEGVVKGFLSHTAPQQIGCADNQIITYCAVIKNFLNYVLAHAVCPEYTETVLAARNVCDVAEKELLAINYLRGGLPGDFSIAASTLFGGRYQGLRFANEQWGAIDPLANIYGPFNQGFDESEAQKIFKTAIALSGTDEMFRVVMNEDVKIIATKKKFLEVIKIELPDPKTVAEYGSVTRAEGRSGYYRPLGRLLVKAWDGPGYEEEDMTDDEDSDSKTSNVGAIEIFWLEHDILKHCFHGLKFEALFHELNIGIKFLDDVSGLYCSFFIFLPNEKMIGWKEPTFVSRGPPTEDDPDVEERAMIGAIENDVKEDERLGEKLMIKTNMVPAAESKTNGLSNAAFASSSSLFED